MLLPATIRTSAIRTPGANLMLEQQRENTGSAAALMSCFGIFMGSVGMAVISLNWGNTIRTLGILNILIGLLGGMLWLHLSRKPYVTGVPERYRPSARK